MSFAENHEELKALFESDPVAFEKKRKEMLQSHIDSQPKEVRESLLNLQSSLDAKLSN